jgi:hypothetical protein
MFVEKCSHKLDIIFVTLDDLNNLFYQKVTDFKELSFLSKLTSLLYQS